MMRRSGHAGRPMTKGTMGRGLILSAMDGQIGHGHGAVEFSVERKKQAAPSSERSALTQGLTRRLS